MQRSILVVYAIVVASLDDLFDSAHTQNVCRVVRRASLPFVLVQLFLWMASLVSCIMLKFGVGTGLNCLGHRDRGVVFGLCVTVGFGGTRLSM